MSVYVNGIRSIIFTFRRLKNMLVAWEEFWEASKNEFSLLSALLPSLSSVFPFLSLSAFLLFFTSALSCVVFFFSFQLTNINVRPEKQQSIFLTWFVSVWNLKLMLLQRPFAGCAQILWRGIFFYTIHNDFIRRRNNCYREYIIWKLMKQHH